MTETDEHFIERKVDVVVKQTAPTTLFSTKDDAATFCLRQADQKKIYYGQMLKATKDNHFRP